MVESNSETREEDRRNEEGAAKANRGNHLLLEVEATIHNVVALLHAELAELENAVVIALADTLAVWQKSLRNNHKLPAETCVHLHSNLDGAEEAFLVVHERELDDSPCLLLVDSVDSEDSGHFDC